MLYSTWYNLQQHHVEWTLNTFVLCLCLNYSHFRLLQFTRKGDNDVCRTDVLYFHYKTYCHDNGLTANTEQSIKTTVSSLYGITTSTIQQKKQKITVYKGLMYCPQPSNDAVCSNSLPDGWFIVSQHNDEITYGQKTGIYINDVEIHKEVVIYDTGLAEIVIRRKHIAPQDIGLPSSLHNSVLNLHGFLSRVSEINICVGKLHTTNDTFICDHNGDITTRKFSKTCHVAMSVLSRGHTCQRCHSIGKHTDTINPPIPPSHAYEPTQPNDDSSKLNMDGNIHEEFDISNFFPGANDTLLQFLQALSQYCKLQHFGIDPCTRRWSGEVLSLAMSIWIASPVTYRLLLNYFYMPSEKLLHMYKNNVNKSPGDTHDMITWMYHEFQRTNPPLVGGIVFDEMVKQPAIQLQPKGSALEMFGFVDFGEGSDGIHKQQKSSNALQLATTVLQWVFLGLNGFRFPFCYMLNKGLTAGQICTMFWNIISTLQTYDFKIIFISMDGASSNRSFLNMICNSATYLAKNISSTHNLATRQKGSPEMGRQESFSTSSLKLHGHSTVLHKRHVRLTQIHKYIAWKIGMLFEVCV